ncbi:MAG: CHAT domain-containing protein [Desertifilum sp. SIO1I2]|nr:CHAT domain-containing protein [Desertifilum sp. SIO1I2]
MTITWILLRRLIAGLAASLWMVPSATFAQGIIPAADSTNTQVLPAGNQFNIQGGQRSGDGANLFHGFQQFNLSPGQIANFLTTPQIQNILGRINGGDVSIINGLIQVTGGNSNLYLMNPAGIVFGSSAQLNVSGSFLATTANSIGFSPQQWFPVAGDYNAHNLLGTPNQFLFSALQPGAIINLGNLQVSSGESIRLLAGNILNSGTLQSPGGEITIASVPGEKLVRLSQSGHLLSLEIHPSHLQSSSPISPLSLPQLITAAGVEHATQLSTNESGQILLQGSPIGLTEDRNQTAIAHRLDVSNPVEIRGGEINILGDRIFLVNAHLNADGTNSGGNIRIGGDFQGEGNIPNAQTTFVNSNSRISANALPPGEGGRIIIWADRNTAFSGFLSATGYRGGFVEVSGKDNLWFRGQADVSGRGGNAGTILFDPKNITIADGGSDPVLDNSQFTDNSTGSATFDADLINNLTGNVILEAHNDITVSEPIISSTLASLELKAGRSLNINADIDMSGSNGDLILRANNAQADLNIRDPGEATITQASGTTLNAGSGNILIEMGTLNSPGSITLGNLVTQGGDIQVLGQGNINLTGDIFTQVPSGTAGDITLATPFGTISAATNRVINANSEDISLGRGGNIILEALGDITTSIVSAYGADAGGNIRLTSTQGAINTTAITSPFEEFANLNTFSANGIAGEITLEAFGNITTRRIAAGAGVSGSQGTQAGNITVTSQTGNIEILAPDNPISIFALSPTGFGGNVALTALEGKIQTGDMQADGALQGGNITLEAREIQTGSLFLGNTEFNFANAGKGGAIRLQATGDISVGDINTQGFETSGAIAISTTQGTIQAGQLLSASDGGEGGNIRLTGSRGVSVGDVQTTGRTHGGSIEIISDRGSLTLGGGVNSTSSLGTGGQIALNAAQGNLTISGDIRSSGLEQGGNITLEAVSGAINTTAGSVSSFSANGVGGDIALNALTEIMTGHLDSYGFTQGGNITLQTQEGFIDTSTGFLSSYSEGGFAGEVRLDAFLEITTNSIRSEGKFGGGNIQLTSQTGGIDTQLGIIRAESSQGNGGTIRLEALRDVQTGFIRAFSTGDATARGGDIELISRRGAIATTTGDLAGEAIIADNADVASQTVASIFRQEFANLDAYSRLGIAGKVTLTAQNGITTSHISSFGGVRGGDVSLQSQQGNIQTGVIFSYAQQGTGGRISLSTQTLGNIDVQHLATYSAGTQGRGGNINLNAVGEIALNNIASYGNAASGDVTLQSQAGNITTGTIQTLAPSGISGNINLQTLPSIRGDIRTANITSAGGLGAGDIYIVAADGSIITGNITTDGGAGRGGRVVVDAGGSVNTGNITSTGAQGGSDITVSSGTGEVNTGMIATPGGEITINTGATPPPPSKPVPPPNVPILPVPDSQPLPNRPPILPELRDAQLDRTFIRNSLAPAELADRVSTLRSQLDLDIEGRSLNAPLTSVVSLEAIAELDDARSTEFVNYFGEEVGNSSLTTASAREALKAIAQATGTQSAVVYITLTDSQIELIVFTANGVPIRHVVPGVSRQQVLATAKQFYDEITNPRRREFTAYLEVGQQLYDWLIAPIETDLQAESIDTLLFSLDAGLRSLPIAALHDGQQFLIEKYSLSAIPSISLMDTRYRPLKDARVLAMGASEFVSLPPLLSVPVELSVISERLWQGEAFLNAEFTQTNLRSQRQNYPYPIIHLATHADFKPGALSNSYIQLWGNDQLTLDQLRQLGWHHPAVELLVLSACRTAFGDEQAELGFAGLAIQAGVKTALASLWYVSDEGTLALMSEFYQYLSQAPIKAEALRQAQLAMLRGHVSIEDGQLRGSGTRGEILLPPELATLDNQQLNHPYYWSGFTMIGSPW